MRPFPISGPPANAFTLSLELVRKGGEEKEAKPSGAGETTAPDKGAAPYGAEIALKLIPVRDSPLGRAERARIAQRGYVRVKLQLLYSAHQRPSETKNGDSNPTASPAAEAGAGKAESKNTSTPAQDGERDDWCVVDDVKELDLEVIFHVDERRPRVSH